MAEYTAGIDDEGRRLDRVARKVLNGARLGGVYAAIRKGRVRLNGKRAKEDVRVHTGDVITVREERIAGTAYRNNTAAETDGKTDERLALDIIFCNEHLLFINKARGVLSHGRGSAAEEVLRLWNNGGHEASLSFRPGPLHRLDRAASGVLTFSQSLKGAAWFTNEMKAHNIKKTYTAILQGTLPDRADGGAYVWIDNITDGGANAFYTMRVTDGEHGKKAVTSVRPIKPLLLDGGKATLVKVVIETGRKHQIRCQCAYHGHPIIGDEAYGGIAHRGEGIFLHCARLEMPANGLGVPRIISAPMPSWIGQYGGDEWEV